LSNDADDSDRLKALEAKIAALKAEPEVKDHSEEHYSQAQLAWRMVIELVAGIAIGFGMGYGLDGLMGTRPIFMLIFLVLGFAAGIRVMMQTAKQAQKDALRYAEEETAALNGSTKED